MSQTAIILVALGGPRSLEEVIPFMTAFMGRPAPESVASAVLERYKVIGGKSPLPDLVKAQAQALERELSDNFRVYEGFRYSSPTISESFDKAISNGARRVVALSMSPFSTEVTTGIYKRACAELGSADTRPLFISSWHDNPLFIQAWQEQVFQGLKRFWTGQQKHVVVIFTSHSIPIRYIEAGDPYKQQIEETVNLIVKSLDIKNWRIAWQSKGARTSEPWLGPEVEQTLDRIAQEGFKEVLEVPVGFTCDHMETLYDIDVVHRSHAIKLGLSFERAESLNISTPFIKALADIVKRNMI